MTVKIQKAIKDLSKALDKFNDELDENAISGNVLHKKDE